MLKACCDCIAAGIREENEAYGPETIQLNGRLPRTPIWPEANNVNRKMLLLPRILNVGDEINVTGLILSNPQWISVSLVSELNGTNGNYNNIIGQLHIDFPSNDLNKGKIVLKTQFEEITSDMTPLDLLPGYTSGESFQVTIGIHLSMNGNVQELEFYIGESHVENIPLQQNFSDMKYIILDGDVDKVKKLDFSFQ